MSTVAMHLFRGACALTTAFSTLVFSQSTHDRPTRRDDLPLVSTDALIELITVDELLAGEQQLQDFAYSYPERNRVFGGAAHNDTIHFIYDTLVATGAYDVYLQEQVHEYSQSDTALAVNGAALETFPMSYSPSGNVSAAIVPVSNLGCNASDFSAEVEGRIALISRGTCTFSDKVALAGAAGAVGAIVYNNVPGDLGGTLGSSTNPLGDYAPALGITQADGQALLAQLANTTLVADLFVDSLSENRTTYNVIAQTLSGDPNNVVSLGAHTDSVRAGPGINDDGSGTISNLVLAKALANFRVNNAVRFGWWTAEEFGLLGSGFYVASLDAAEVAKIRLFLDFDMVASPNYVYAIYDGDGKALGTPAPDGSAAIEYLFESYFERLGLNYTFAGFDGRSDYAAFFDAGIPCGGLFTGAEGIKTEEEAALFGGEAGVAYDVNYHGVADNITNLAVDAFKINADATAFVVATYALSLDGLAGNGTNATGVERRTAGRTARRSAKASLPKLNIINGKVVTAE